jgi:hypothetical protein
MSYATAVILEAVLLVACARWRGGWGYAVLLVLAVVPADVVRAFSLTRVHTPGTWAGASSWRMGTGLALAATTLYCTYGLVPVVAALCPVRRRTLFVLGGVLLVGSLVNGVWSVAPPWVEGYPRAANQFVYTRHLLADDVQPYAAFPSLHVGVPLAIAVGQRSWRWLVYASVVGVVVVVAGEHWILDVVGAVALVAVCEVVCAGVGARVSWSAGKRQDLRNGGDGGGVAARAPW